MIFCKFVLEYTILVGKQYSVIMRLGVSGLCVEDISDIIRSGLGHWVSLNFISGTSDCIQMISTGVGCLPDIAPHIRTSNGEDSKTTPKLVGVFDNEMAQSIIARIHSFHLGGIRFQGNVSPIFLDNLRRTIMPDLCPEMAFVKYISGESCQIRTLCDVYEAYVDAFLLDGYSDESFSHVQRFLGVNGEKMVTPFFIRVAPDTKRVMACLREISHPSFGGIDIDFSHSKSVAEILSVLREVSAML